MQLPPGFVVGAPPLSLAGAPLSPTSDRITGRVTQLKHACFQFGTRSIATRGEPADHCHPNVLCLQIQHTLFDKVIKYLFGILSFLFHFLSQEIDAKLQHKFPEWFLPDKIILKSQKPNWEEEFDKELEAYHKLQRLQGTVIPRFHGTIQFNNVSSMILSDVGGHCLSVPEGAVLEKEDLWLLLEQAHMAIADLGAYHDDIKLDNFHLVTDNGKDKIMILDLESVGFELSGEQLSHVAKGSAAWLIDQYEDHLKCMECDGIILPKRPLRT
ncbi:hypothetical protein F52700_11571 [Fusarium sp. NRRL 52700]|nr:hypothetical protein F52700_11571 [Fusarium sp. NRRL 52700]